MHKAASRRFQAAFAKLQVSWILEIGTHAPVAAEVGLAQQSERELSLRLLDRIRPGWCLLIYRLYGVDRFVNELMISCQDVGGQGWSGCERT